MTDSVQDPPDTIRGAADRSDPISRSGKRANSRRRRRRRQTGKAQGSAQRADTSPTGPAKEQTGENRLPGRQSKPQGADQPRRMDKARDAGSSQPHHGAHDDSSVQERRSGETGSVSGGATDKGKRTGDAPAGASLERSAVRSSGQASSEAAGSEPSAKIAAMPANAEGKPSGKGKKRGRKRRRLAKGQADTGAAASAAGVQASSQPAVSGTGSGRTDKQGENASCDAGGEEGGKGQAPAGQTGQGSQVHTETPRRGKGRKNRRRKKPGHTKLPAEKPADNGLANTHVARANPGHAHKGELVEGHPRQATSETAASTRAENQGALNGQGANRLGTGGRHTSHRGGRVHGGYSGPLYAALDLGTNNCRLLIARPDERGFRVVDAYSRIVRLGEGVGKTGLLSQEAMDRAVEALDNCQQKLVERGVERARLIATEACRAAANGSHFIERVKADTGMALEVVDRETEARLAVAGCVSLVAPEADGVILFDIGGGSSEIVWLDLRNRCGARGFALTRFIRSWASLPVGVVNLAERHGGVDVTPEVFEAMVADVADHLQGFALGEDLSAAIRSGGVHMLGTSGTVTTLAGVQLGLKRYDRRRVDGAWLENDQVGSMIDRLRDMSYEERVENPCIGADRADLVLAGCAILEAIRRRWQCSRLRVADRGLREGILTELMAADGVWSKGKGRRPGARRRGKT